MLEFAFDYDSRAIDGSLAICADCFEWLRKMPENSVHAIVTDPPYGVKEFELDQLRKRETGSGGVWRIPPTLDGNARAPLPRFTDLNKKEIGHLQEYFSIWSRLISRILRPGGHLFLASNSYLSQLIFSAVSNQDLQFRGAVIRLVRTMRGGDRPKNAEVEFSGVCSLPRSNYEPWGIFRKAIPKGMRISDCLREYETGGLRRLPNGNPFNDVIVSNRTPQIERRIANHPSLKPQLFLRQLVHTALPLGRGIVVDPFMGSGSTLAAAVALGYGAVGVERYRDYYEMSLQAIPALKNIHTDFDNYQMELPWNG